MLPFGRFLGTFYGNIGLGTTRPYFSGEKKAPAGTPPGSEACILEEICVFNQEKTF